MCQCEGNVNVNRTGPIAKLKLVRFHTDYLSTGLISDQMLHPDDSKVKTQNNFSTKVVCLFVETEIIVTKLKLFHSTVQFMILFWGCSCVFVVYAVRPCKISRNKQTKQLSCPSSTWSAICSQFDARKATCSERRQYPFLKGSFVTAFSLLSWPLVPNHPEVVVSGQNIKNRRKCRQFRSCKRPVKAPRAACEKV